jgi:hypothetical protein
MSQKTGCGTNKQTNKQTKRDAIILTYSLRATQAAAAAATVNGEL